MWLLSGGTKKLTMFAGLRQTKRRRIFLLSRALCVPKANNRQLSKEVPFALHIGPIETQPAKKVLSRKLRRALALLRTATATSVLNQPHSHNPRTQGKQRTGGQSNVLLAALLGSLAYYLSQISQEVNAEEQASSLEQGITYCL